MHTSRQIPRNTSAKVDCERYTMLENYRAHRCIDPRVKVHIEKGQRTGRCLRHLLALSSSKDKPYILAQRNLFPSRSFFFFFSFFRLPLFHFREFVSKSCTRIMDLSEMNGFFGNWLELERNARRINILILANIVKIAITTD